MNEPLSFSIVTPTLNQSGYIKTTIDSVLSQNYPNLKYLVLDAGSNDGTQEILKNYGASFSWQVEAGTTQSAAINKGWREIQGEIVGWINSDDIYYPKTFEQVGYFFRENPDVDMLYGDCDYIDSQGNYLRPYPTSEFDYMELLRETINFIPQPATFIRRCVLDQVGLLDETLDFVMDFEYWLRVGRFCRVVYIPVKFGALRLHPEAKSITKLDRFGKELVEVYKRYFADRNLSPELRNLEDEAMANIYTRAADCAFWGKNYSAARRYAFESWKHQKWPLRKIWLWIFLGKFGGILAEKRLKNPYLP